MEKSILREVVLEQKDLLASIDLGVKREKFDEIKKFIPMPYILVISGIRRVGKSTLLHQLANEFYKDSVYYFNFEDERLIDFTPADFNNLLELFEEIYGEKKVIVFDEIQNVESWELFVRRLQDRRYKFLISGSNASLLSKELGTRLTGRNITFELYPFSFKEFLEFKKHKVPPDAFYILTHRAKLKHYFFEYLEKGGMPEFLKFNDKLILKRVYDDILYRDIVARYDIKEVKALRELALYLLTNTANFFSYNNLKKILGLGSINTVKSYVDFMEDSFLLFTVNKFAYSLKEQFISNKKVYCIDNGLADAISFSFSKNKGKYLENLVAIELKRRGNKFFYYKTKSNQEIDFFIKNSLKNKSLIQVTEHLDSEKLRKREIDSLAAGMKELKINKGLILTEDTTDNIKIKNCNIKIQPIYQWLLG